VSIPAREKPLFNDDQAIITSTRAILGGTTYAVANITSVRYHEQPGPLGLVVFALFVALGGVMVADKYAAATGLGLVVGGLALALIAFAVRKSKHWVLVGTAGAETRAVFSYNKFWTTNVVEALNQAIIDRG